MLSSGWRARVAREASRRGAPSAPHQDGNRNRLGDSFVTPVGLRRVRKAASPGKVAVLEIARWMTEAGSLLERPSSGHRSLVADPSISASWRLTLHLTVSPTPR